MNKNDLSKAIYAAHGGMSQHEALKAVELIFDIIKGRLSHGEKVLISGFGCFRIVQRKDRKGINPQTGAPILIAGRKAVTFKPAKSFKSV